MSARIRTRTTTGTAITGTGGTTGTAISGTGTTSGVALAGTTGGVTATASLAGTSATYRNSNNSGLNVTAATTTVTGGDGTANAAVATLNTGSATLLSGTASGNRGLDINSTTANTTTLTGGVSGTLANSTLIGVAGATQAGAQVTLSGANASLVNNTGHGISVSANQTVITGGTTSTSLTLNDTAATFANTATGGPTTVTGVADGVADFDAVNVRQLKGMEKLLSRGIASTTAIANIPQVDQNKTFSLGAGVGSYNSQTSLAVGGSYRFAENGVLKASVAKSFGSGKDKPAFGVGAAWSW